MYTAKFPKIIRKKLEISFTFGRSPLEDIFIRLLSFLPPPPIIVSYGYKNEISCNNINGEKSV